MVRRGFIERPGGRITTSLSVEAVDGEDARRLASPQKVLDALLDTIAFDPLSFKRMAPGEQYRTITTMCGIDLAAIEVGQKADYAERTRLNREAKERTAAAGTFTIPTEVPERVDVDALLAGVKEAREHNDLMAQREREVEGHERHVDNLRAEAGREESSVGGEEESIANLEHRIAEVRRSIKARKEKIGSLKGEARRGVAKANEIRATIAARVDTSGMDDKIRRGHIDNTTADMIADRVERRDDCLGEAQAAAQAAAKVTARMDARAVDLKAQVEAADLPVDGLTLDRGIVTL